MQTKRSTHFLIAALLLTLFPAVFSSAQEPPSLGDVARRLRNEKSGVAATPTAASPASATLPDKNTTSELKPGSIIAPGSKQVIEDDISPYEQHIRDLLIAEKFAEIDQLADAARTSKSRFRGGPWVIHVLYNQLAGLPEKSGSELEWEKNIARFKRWMAKSPDSITARLALAVSYDQFGWFARGNGYADNVTDQSWQVFNDRMQLARKVLTDPFFDKHKDPEWFLELQDIARAQGAEISEQQAIFNKAVAFEPEYQYYYRKQAEMLLPKWYGNGTDAAEFARLAADRIGGQKGDFIYYQIAASLYCHCDDKTDYEAMDWARIKRGFRVEEEMFGVSNFELNRMAIMASFRTDPKYADELLTRIQKWDPEIWSSEQGFEEMKAWAKKELKDDSAQ